MELVWQGLRFDSIVLGNKVQISSLPAYVLVPAHKGEKELSFDVQTLDSALKLNTVKCLELRSAQALTNILPALQQNTSLVSLRIPLQMPEKLCGDFFDAISRKPNLKTLKVVCNSNENLQILSDFLSENLHITCFDIIETDHAINSPFWCLWDGLSKNTSLQKIVVQHLHPNNFGGFLNNISRIPSFQK